VAAIKKRDMHDGKYKNSLIILSISKYYALC
jgi:hypothetical protein